VKESNKHSNRSRERRGGGEINTATCRGSIRSDSHDQDSRKEGSKESDFFGEKEKGERGMSSFSF